MSLALARSAAKSATAFAAGVRPVAPRASCGRHMVISRGDCVGLKMQEGATDLLEMKERLQQELEGQMKAVLQWTEGRCTEHSTSALETVVMDVPDADAKLAKCQALAEEAMGGVLHSARSITELLVDCSPEVRCAALEALVCIAKFGPLSAVSAVGMALRLSDPGLRWRGHEQSLVMAALAERVGA